MEFVDLLPYLGWIIGGAFALGAGGFVASIHNTRPKVKHGYPLEGMWGQSLKPGMTSDAQQRVTLLTQENAELRAEIGSLKDRLGNVERIVTEEGYHLTREIDRLRGDGSDGVVSLDDGRKERA
ncbi:MAG: hypothetical protein COW16_07020 [Sphingomonadales bacterium CG12_big_fil_rev_8_21_14_0_65_65_10]|nr:MAG: hypothetical protein COW16_07020 [Sphingomonadales bacterium CG12_big_fil_rev_8_21_14_0_65_65_10]